MVFVYLHARRVIISPTPSREMRMLHRGIELLASFHLVQDALMFADHLHLPVQNDVISTFSGITPEGRERMRERKRGDKNPNAGGLSREHRAAISRSMKKQRGEHHPMWNRRHTMPHRRNISFGMMQIPKRRWALDPEGREHLIAANSTLPPGWTWGRRRGVTHHI